MRLESAAPDPASNWGKAASAPAEGKALPPSQLAGRLTIKSYESR